MDTLTDLLEEQLKDLYNAENQLTKAMPRMAKKVSTDELKQAFLTHHEETLGQIERLEQIGELLEIKLTGKVCAAMKGLIEEAKEVLEEDGHPAVIDAALIAAAQRVEHYEIAAYGTVKAIAQQLGLDEVVGLLDETLKQEVATDEKLTQVAEESVYSQTPKSEDDESDEDDGDDEEDGEEEEVDDDEEAPATTGRAAPRGKGNRTPPSKAAASKGGKNSGGAKNLKKGTQSRR